MTERTKNIGNLRQKVAEKLVGHEVFVCTQKSLVPVSKSRARRGLETGLEVEKKVWLEVDGKETTYPPTMVDLQKIGL